MNTTRLNPLAEDFLRRLDAEARMLPDQDREDLLTELRSHLEAGLGEDASDADVRNLLADVGSPADIVAAATSELDADSAVGQRASGRTPSDRRDDPWGTVEIVAVLGLTVGAILIPVLGPLVGLCFAWASTRWTTREKVVATVLTLLPLVTLALGATVIVTSGAGGSVPHPVPQVVVGVLS